MANITQTILAAEKVLKEIKEQKGKITYPINPFELLKEQQAIITYSDFDKLEGLLLYDKEKTVVAINMNRPITRQRFTAAHELGHMLLHKQSNVLFMDTRTQFVTSKFEQEANKFAAELLISDDILEEYKELTIEQFSRLLGYDKKFIELRVK